MPDIQVTVRDGGHLIGDGEMLQRLRAVASDVGCASFELEDDNGTLSIVLDFPSLDLDKAKNAARRFAELADFDRAHVGRLD